jgi:hypothetical protein
MRDDIDKFNENLIRMASNKSIYHTGNLNTQNSPTKISELTLDLKKTKSNNLNNTNANENFGINLTSTNLDAKFESCNNNFKNIDSNSSNPNKIVNNQFNSIIKSQNESSKTLEIKAEGKNYKEKKLDFSFTNQNQFFSGNNESTNKTEISRASTIDNNKTVNITGSNSHLINGYTNVNRISPNINTTLNQIVGKNSVKTEANNIIDTTIADNENIRHRERYLTIKDYFDNNESRGSGHFNSISLNNNIANNEKIILGKNQIKNISNDLNGNLNSNNRIANNEKNINKQKDTEIANYFSKKPVSNKKSNNNISLLNLRKGKEKDIDRESIFSIKTNLNFDYNKSPVINPSNICTYYNLLSNLILIFSLNIYRQK